MHGCGYTLVPYATAKERWEKLSPEHPIKPEPAKFVYRGQWDAGLKLTPSVLREKSVVKDCIPSSILKAEMQIFAEVRLLAEFARQCDTLGLRLPMDSIGFRKASLDTNNLDRYTVQPSKWPDEYLLELMAMAQHHGIPTRLLDWSRRAHVAVYFCSF